MLKLLRLLLASAKGTILGSEHIEAEKKKNRRVCMFEESVRDGEYKRENGVDGGVHEALLFIELTTTFFFFLEIY